MHGWDRIKKLASKDEDIILQEAIEPIVDQACRDFSYAKTKSWPSLALPVAHLAFPTFWESEASFRLTENGKDPPDWDERRRIIFNRDGGRCQRCGINMELDECHIHHIKPRARGGDHSLTNLVTLCRSCHPLMPGHEHMKEVVSYYITGRIIHSYRCSIVKNGEQPTKKIWASLTDLLGRGYVVCKRCNPWNVHYSSERWWKPDLAFFAKQRVKELVTEELASFN